MNGRFAFAAAILAALVAGALLLGGPLHPDGAGAAGAKRLKSGLYRGKTAQGGRVSFRVGRGRVTRPGYTVYNRRCGVKITFPAKRRVNRRGRFFFGRRSSDFFTGRFVGRGRVRGNAGVDFTGSACPGRGVKKVRFRARRVR